MIDAIEHAERVYRTRDRLSREQLIAEAVALGEWGPLTNKHVSDLTGLHPAFVTEVLKRPDKPGDLNPERLADVAEVATARRRGEFVRDRVIELLGDGFSADVLARLTGINVGVVRRWGKA